MTYIDYNGHPCSLNDFFDDYVLDSLVRFDDDRDYIVTDIFDCEGVTFMELDGEDGQTLYLSEDFYICQELSDYFNDDVELSKLYPTNVHNPMDGYEDYLYEMARDKELLGW